MTQALISKYFDTDKLFKKDGIWYSKENQNVSYPKEGNTVCFELEAKSYWFHHRNKVILHFFKKYSTGSFLLDIGGGNGLTSAYLQDQGVDVILLEPGVHGVKNAQQRGLNQIVCSTLDCSGIKLDVLPAVGFFDVLEHIKDDDEFLKKVKQAVMPGGIIYLTVPAFNMLWSEEDIDAGHFRRYTLGSIERQLSSIGFNVVYSNYFFFLLPIPIFLMRTLPTLLKINKQKSTHQRAGDDHGVNGGLGASFLAYLLKIEFWLIKRGFNSKLGSSCFIIAKRSS